MSNSPKLLSRIIEEKLESAIVKNEYKVGDKLPTEIELCDQFSTSRTAVREALKSLKTKGLIEIRKGSGVYVSELTIANALGPINLYFELSKDEDLVSNAIKARLYIEPEVAAMAAMNRTEEHLAALEANLEAMIDCPTNDIETETKLDIAFHVLVTQATGNPVVSLIMEPVLNLISKYKPLIFGKHANLDRKEIKQSVIKFHSRIYEAIKNKDSKEAHYEMKEHLRVTEKNSIKAIQP